VCSKSSLELKKSDSKYEDNSFVAYLPSLVEVERRFRDTYCLHNQCDSSHFIADTLRKI
jgi:hypothetical protein